MSDATGMSGVAELQELLLATDTLQEFLHEVAYRAAAEVSPGLSCGLTARSDGRPLTITLTRNDVSAKDADAFAILVQRVENGRPGAMLGAAMQRDLSH